MADYGQVDTSIYRPQPQPNPLATIAGVGHAADSLGNLAVGGALQQAIDPATGQIDANKVAALLQQSPVGAMKAPQTLDALNRLRSSGYAADQAGLETFQKRMAIVNHLFAPIASKTDPSIDDVYDAAAAVLDPALNANEYGITLPVVMNAIKQFRGPDGKPLPPDQIRKKALDIQTMAASTAEILHQHSPQMQVVNQGGQTTFVPAGTPNNPALNTAVPNTLPPTTLAATPQGQQYLGAQPPVVGGGAMGPGGAPTVAAPPSAPPVPRGPAATLPPGYTQAAEGIGTQSAASATALTAANDTSMVRKGMLGNLEDDLNKFTAGPGADWTKLAKAWTNRNIPGIGGQPWFDPNSIASQEQFNKQAAMLAQQQFAAIGGTGTDAKFSSAFTTSPNELLSQLGNQGIIRLLKGNEDAIQAKNTAWQKWLADGHGPQTYAQFSTGFNQNFDPRAFQFKYLKPADRQAYVDAMDPDDRQRFLFDLTHARKQGWIQFAPPAKN